MPQPRKLFAEDIEKIMEYKGKQGELLYPEVPNSKTVVSTYSIGKIFGVSNVTVHRIWNGTYQWQKIPIDVKLAKKLIKFFADPKVRENIPDDKKEEFLDSLSEVEEKRVKKIIRG